MRPEHWIYTVPLRLRSLFRRSRVERDLEDEMQFHLARQIEEGIESGKTFVEARYSALQALGGIEQRKEECRDVRGVRWLQDLSQDAGYAARTLLKTPGFTFVSIAVLSLGIGANTAVFTVVNSTLLRPLPYAQPDRLCLISSVPKKLLFDPGPIMMDRDYLEFRRRNHSFESLATLSSARAGKMTLTEQGNPAVLSVSKVGPDLMRVLRVHSLVGREFLAEGLGDANVVLLSHQLWMRRFGGDRNAIGKALILDGVSYSIAGVMPPSFNFQSADLWVREELRVKAHNAYLVPVLGRLKPGVSLRQARAELEVFAAGLRDDNGIYGAGSVSRILPLKDLFVAGFRKLLLVFAGAVALVFLIACANFANLLLIRGAGRQPEMAVRAALGASRSRLLRQLLVESTLLSMGGAILGILLSVGGVRLLMMLLPAEQIASAADLHVHIPVLAFAFALSLITGLVFGLIPSLQVTRRELREGLSEGGRNVLLRREGLRSALVVVEIALALVLLTGAGLLAKSFLRMRAINPGFQSANLAVASVDLPQARYRNAVQMRIFDESALAALAGLPGAKSVAAVSFLPFGWGVRGDFHLEDARRLPDDFRVDKPVVSPDYFHALGIRILGGRAFTSHDILSAPGVAIVSESLARRLWPGGDAIGKRLSMEEKPKAEDWLTIVGIASDVRQGGLNDTQRAVIYQPYEQMNQGAFLDHMSFVVLSDHPSAMAAGIRAVLRKLDKDLPTDSITTMDAIVAGSMLETQSETRLLGVFSLVALTLACVGIYGVLACSVKERTHEIGIRMAVGARGNDIVWLIFRRTLLLIGTGVLLGLLGALATTQVLAKFLFEVTPTDPVTFLEVAGLLVAIALGAAILPARRAASLYPTIVLRHE